VHFYQSGLIYFDHTIFTNDYFSPKEELVLRSVAGESERVEVVILRNTGKKNAIFKIKTTSPEKFRVRPSTGVIGAGELFVIRLYVQSGMF
jgi:hypothetical protein